MASDQITFKIRVCPDDETMQVILLLLNMWQDNNPDYMVAMVPEKDRYQYEIIKSGRMVGNRERENDPGGAGRAD